MRRARGTGSLPDHAPAGRGAPPPHRDLPPGFRLELDAGARWAGPTVLIGGSPVRLLRLTAAGRRTVDRLAAGEPVPDSPGAQALARRLLDGGLAHPRPAALVEAPDVVLVIPVRDDPTGLETTLEALGGVSPIVVVDDASADSAAVTRVAGRGGATVLRQPEWLGPAGARNAGWRATTAGFVAFLDADCIPGPDWLDRLLPHFADPAVAAVAPRIISVPQAATPPALAAYETVRSALDLGPAEAPVRPRSAVAYTPTAALVVRRAALEAIGGFDDSLVVGEDVDLVWRLAAAGWTVRYEPGATVAHPDRAGWAAWVRQRHKYGTSAAPLARRHGAAVSPLSMSPWSAAAWGLVAVGRPVGGAALAAGSTAALARRLWALHPAGGTGTGAATRARGGREALRLAGMGHLRAGLAGADALRRAWPPAALVLGAASRRSRPALAAAVVIPPLLEWLESRPRLDPVRFIALRLADDLAYAAGVWAGCVRERSARALLPDLSGWNLRDTPRP